VFECDKDIAEIEKILRDISDKYKDTDITVKTGEIYPTDNAPVLFVQEGRPALGIMKWGFPKWDGSGVIINAKSETAAQKKMFAKPLALRRCIILSTGFYEWAKLHGKAKEKHQFNDPYSSMLYMAGIYADYPDKDGNLATRFVILTRDANSYISDIHDRMPVILYKDELVRWLTDYDFAVKMLERDGVVLKRVSIV